MYVGCFASIGFVLLLWAWGWLKGFTMHQPQRFIVDFHDVAGLNTNAPVNINGVRVGVVEKIELVKKGEVKCSLKINSEDAIVRKGSRFTIQTLGLVGAKYVEITLPDVKANGEEPPPPIQPGEELQGQDPVRTELILNKIATNVGQIDFNEKFERVAQAADSLQATSKKFGDAAADAKGAAHNAKEFFGRSEKSLDSIDHLANDWRSGSSGSFRHINALADDWRVTSHKVNKILDNPALSADLKETATKAKETADSIQIAIHELNGMVGDKGTRDDVITMLSKLNDSTENIYKSVQEVHKLSDDQGVRSDLKQILSDAKVAMSNLNSALSDKDFKSNLMNTADKVRTAATHVNFAALQLSQALDKRAPLLHMMFGRPGHIATEDDALKTQQENDQKAKNLIKNAPADPNNMTPPPATIPNTAAPSKESTKDNWK